MSTESQAAVVDIHPCKMGNPFKNTLHHYTWVLMILVLSHRSAASVPVTPASEAEHAASAGSCSGGTPRWSVTVRSRFPNLAVPPDLSRLKSCSPVLKNSNLNRFLVALGTEEQPFGFDKSLRRRQQAARCRLSHR